jgi:hypothetical protein
MDCEMAVDDLHTQIESMKLHLNALCAVMLPTSSNATTKYGHPVTDMTTFDISVDIANNLLANASDRIFVIGTFVC